MPKDSSRVTVIKGGKIFTGKVRQELIDGGWIIIKDGEIARVGKGDYTRYIRGQKASIIDATDRIVTPGLINCHTHLYSTLARGFVQKASPRNFVERLETLWWRLDKALTYEDCYWSALVGSLLSLKAGVTTVLDHHSSPYAIDQSLDAIAGGMRQVGIRGAVCYEVSDRDGQDRAQLGIEENLRFARVAASDSRIACLMGLHASFTLSEPTLLRAREAADEANLGFHIHVAEDAADVIDSQKRYRRRVVTRLADAGILSDRSLAIHCVHVSDQEIRILSQTGANVIHCPRSNLSNAVGVAPIAKMFRHGVRVGLGSDGFGANILDDAYTSVLNWRLVERLPTAGFIESEVLLLHNNQLIASSILGRPVGLIERGHAADIVIFDYDPPTPVNGDNLWGHFLSKEMVAETVLVDGRVVLSKGKACLVDEVKVFERSRELATRLWERI